MSTYDEVRQRHLHEKNQFLASHSRSGYIYEDKAEGWVTLCQKHKAEMVDGFNSKVFIFDAIDSGKRISTGFISSLDVLTNCVDAATGIPFDDLVQDVRFNEVAQRYWDITKKDNEHIVSSIDQLTPDRAFLTINGNGNVLASHIVNCDELQPLLNSMKQGIAHSIIRRGYGDVQKEYALEDANRIVSQVMSDEDLLEKFQNRSGSLLERDKVDHIERQCAAFKILHLIKNDVAVAATEISEKNHSPKRVELRNSLAKEDKSTKMHSLDSRLTTKSNLSNRQAGIRKQKPVQQKTALRSELR